MKDTDITNGCLSSRPVCVELATLGDAAGAFGGEEVAAVLGCSEVTPLDVVKAAAYVSGCPPAFCLEAGLGF